MISSSSSPLQELHTVVRSPLIMQLDLNTWKEIRVEQLLQDRYGSSAIAARALWKEQTLFVATKDEKKSAA